MKIVLTGHRGYRGRGPFHYLSRRHQVSGWDQQEDPFTLDAAFLKKHDIALVRERSPVLIENVCPQRFQQIEP